MSSQPADDSRLTAAAAVSGAHAVADIPDSNELRTKLTWLAVFRLSVNSALLAFLVARRALAPPTETPLAEQLAFGLIGVVYLMTFGYAVALRSGFGGALSAYIQVLGDVVLASSVVFLTGAGESPFTFVYSVAVVAAALLLDQRGALAAAASSALAFATVVLLVQMEWVIPPGGGQALSLSRIVFLLVSNGLAQMSIGILAAFLARQLAYAGGRVIANQAKIAELVDLQNLILTAMPGGLLVCESDGKVTYMNAAAETILGRIDVKRPGMAEKLLPGLGRLPAGAKRSELNVSTAMGDRILGLAVTTLDEKVGSKLVVFQDLTELRRAEAQLRTVDHLASLGKFSAQLAHEIRNPLASMRGAAQMLGDEAGANTQASRLSRILIREADRLSELVSDFLRFARPPPPKLAPLDLAKLIFDALEMLKTDPLSQNVNLEMAAESVWAIGDAAQLKQVVINLVRNALAAVGPGGTVRLSTHALPDIAEFRVWDSAGKIPIADLTRIFEPFYSTRAGGTGLGLSTTHNIIRTHGGKISVQSAPSTGTEFVVSLPRAGGSATP